MSGPSVTKLSILIVSYNTREMTRACLQSLPQSDDYQVIVLDNASSDGSADAIAAHSSRPQLIASTENVGFARANNLAAKEARGEFLLLLNPDTVVLPGAIEELVAFAERTPEARLWGGRTLFGDGGLNATSCFADMTPWSLAARVLGLTALAPASEWCNPETYGRWLRDTERDVDIITGCFLLVRRDFWERLGGFDPDFFMYGEEVDLCLRARAFGARPRVTPAATIIHYGGQSEKTRVGRAIKVFAAKAMLIRRHWSPGWKSVGLALLFGWPASRWLALSLAARVLHRKELAEAAQIWGEVTRRRSEWLAGFGRFDAARNTSPIPHGGVA
jgi:GT2 family glycosyltransferase